MAYNFYVNNVDWGAIDYIVRRVTSDEAGAENLLIIYFNESADVDQVITYAKDCVGKVQDYSLSIIDNDTQEVSFSTEMYNLLYEFSDEKFKNSTDTEGVNEKILTWRSVEE